MLGEVLILLLSVLRRLELWLINFQVKFAPNVSWWNDRQNLCASINDSETGQCYIMYSSYIAEEVKTHFNLITLFFFLLFFFFLPFFFSVKTGNAFLR